MHTFIKSNWLGNSEWKGFYEIKTEGWFNVHSSKYMGTSFEIPYTPDVHFGNFSIKNFNTKKNILEFSQINYIKKSADEWCDIDVSKKFHINYRGDNYEDTKFAFKNKPEYSAKHWLCGVWGWYEAPNGLYDKCKILADKIALETAEIWSKYEKEIPNCKLIR